MLPLDVINQQGQLNNPNQLKGWLSQLKSGNVDGVMTDVWWGLVEQQPQQYDWTAYEQLFQMCKDAGLDIQVNSHEMAMSLEFFG